MRRPLGSAVLVLLAAHGASAQTVSTDRSTYVVGEHVRVAFAGSTDAQDWVGVYPAAAGFGPGAPSTYWQYTNGAQTGTGAVVPGGELRFLPFSLPPGDYEARFFADDGYALLASAAFDVVDGATAPAPTSSGCRRRAPRRRSRSSDTCRDTPATRRPRPPVRRGSSRAGRSSRRRSCPGCTARP